MKPSSVDLSTLCEKFSIADKDSEISNQEAIKPRMLNNKLMKENSSDIKSVKEMSSFEFDEEFPRDVSTQEAIKQRMLNNKLLKENSSITKSVDDLFAELSISELDEEFLHEMSSSLNSPVHPWSETSPSTQKALKNHFTTTLSYSPYQVSFVHKFLQKMSRKSHGGNVFERKASKTVLFQKLLDPVKQTIEKHGRDDYDGDDDDDDSKIFNHYGEDDDLFN